MDRKKAISILGVIALAAVVVAAFVMWPKRYTVAQRVTQAAVFWNDHDAFLFVTLNSTGRSRNVLQEKLDGTGYAYLALLAGGMGDFYKQDLVAYHLTPAGTVERCALPEKVAAYGSWTLADGQLQRTAPYSATQDWVGVRWDGGKFVAVPAAAKPQPQPQPAAAAHSNLTADDLNDNEDDSEEGDVFLSKTSRKAFKAAGWHYKMLSAYGAAGNEATLPIVLSEKTFNLVVTTFPVTKSGAARLDFISLGMKSIAIAGDTGAGAQALWQQNGWQEMAKGEYEQMRAQYGRGRPRPSVISLIWLGAAVLVLLWRFGSWMHLIFAFATMKQRVLKNMATAYSFPPATAAQFPLLDLAELDRYTREFEGMGFIRLLDFSLASDSKNQPPSFCRLLVNPRHHCFGELSQIFPKGKGPLPLKGSIQSCLQNGWTLGFSDRKPQAASSLIRREKAVGVCMPEAKTSELLQAFLSMREQICLDLGIQTVNDDTLDAYIAKMQRSITDMREAVQNKSFVKGVPEVYLRKLSLLKTKPEYIWLGDYPKEADQRKQGLSTFAAGAR